MTTYTAIADSEIDIDSPITTSLMTRLRDNPIAIAEGDSAAPNITIWRNVEVFTSSGTWTKPANVDYVYVKVQGGGACVNGGAGNGGGYIEGVCNVVGNVTITRGAAGTTGTTSNGGNSSFGTFLVAQGGGVATPSGGSSSGVEWAFVITGGLGITESTNLSIGGSSHMGNGAVNNGTTTGNATGYGGGGTEIGASSQAASAGVVIVYY